MSTSDDPLTKALWSRVVTFWPPAVVSSVQEGVERARRQPYAFIVDSPIAAYLAGRQPCELYVTEPFLDQMLYAFAVRRGSRRMRAALDRELRRAKSTGEMQSMYLHWWKNECVAERHEDWLAQTRISPMTRDVLGAPGRHADASSASNDCSRTASRTLCLTAAVVALWMLSKILVDLTYLSLYRQANK